MRCFLITTCALVLLSGCDNSPERDADVGDSDQTSDGDIEDADVDELMPCPGCRIGLICYPNGVTHPENKCSICDVSRSTDGWSNNDGATCDDGDFCTEGDVCAAGVCSGLPRSCDDGVGCNGEERCDEELDACTPGETTCGPNELCDLTSDTCVTTCTGCAIAGSCYGDGQLSTTNPCLICDAASDDEGWTDNDGATCDDGSFCNGGDLCSGGECVEHLVDPCDGAECLEEEARCCRPDDYLACDPSGDIMRFDGCGRPLSVVEDCRDDLHAACRDLTCACEDGWGGFRCERCVRYVDGADGDDTNSGDSWAEALASIEAGLDAASAAGCEVWVTGGTYVPAVPDPLRTDSFVVPSGVALFGGFAGDEHLRAQRDLTANPTVLSGDIGSSEDVTDNLYHVVQMESSTQLDGFTISGGNANRLMEERDRVGGGLLAEASPVVVSRCTFVDNRATLRGGAIDALDSSMLIVSSRFESNTSGDGGAVAFETQPGAIVNSVFQHNTAIYEGGALWAEVSPLEAAVTIASSTFWGNEALSRGGAIATGADTTVDVSNSILWGDTAPEASEATSAVVFSYSNVEGTEFDGRGGNWSIDPLFVNVDETVGEVDLGLRNGSRCVNSGSSEELPLDETDLDEDGIVSEPLPFDVEGRPRELSFAPDIGAFELDDRLPPGVTSLEVIGQDLLRLRFDEQIDQTTGVDLSTYEFSDGLTATEARVSPDRRRVTFSMSPLTDCAGYELTLNGVTDVVGNPLPHGTVVPFIAEPVLLDERFDDGDALGWSFVDEGLAGDPSSWIADGEALTQRSCVWATAPYRIGTYALWTGSGATEWTDYTLRANLLTPDLDGIGLMFRVADGQTCYRLELDWRRTYRKLSRLEGGHETVLAENPTARFRSDHYFEIEIRVRGASIEVAYDGLDMFGGPIVDSAHGAGSVALYNWGNTHAQYDDVTVVGTCP